MNRIKCSAIEAEFQEWLLLVEAKNNVEQEAKDGECCDAECNWWNREFTSCFTENKHGGRLLLTCEKF